MIASYSSSSSCSRKQDFSFILLAFLQGVHKLEQNPCFISINRVRTEIMYINGAYLTSSSRVAQVRKAYSSLAKVNAVKDGV